MDDFLEKLLEILKKLNIKPVVYGSVGVSVYFGNFKEFEDIDFLVEDKYLNSDWETLKNFLESKGFILTDEKEHEFKLGGRKVGFASSGILFRDKIVDNYSQLVKFKNTDALTLTPADFLKAYKFSLKDGYRIHMRNKKDKEIIERLEAYLKTV